MPPRRRPPLRLIPDPRARGEAFTKRTNGLKKMAWQLSVLCDVNVALVVAGADKEDTWESREGVVLARYRALPPATRARHTHRAYLGAELGREAAALARVRQAGPAALRLSDAPLGTVAATEGDARRMLDALDAAIRAVDERRTALGVPVGDDDDGGVLEGIAPLGGFAAGVDRGPTGGDGDIVDGEVLWGNDGGGGFEPCGAGDAPPSGYGFQQWTASSGVGMEGYQMAPVMYGFGSSNSHLADDAYTYQLLGHALQPNVTPHVWSVDETRHVMVPAEYTFADDTGLSYSYSYMVDTQANATSASNFAMGASGNFLNSPPELSLAMATGGGGGNFVSATPPAAFSHALGDSDDSFTIADVTPAQPLAMSYGADLTNAGWYPARWQQAAPEPQRGGGGREPIEQLHYFGDMEDTQLHL
ncbi:hypothetical protein HU200_035984 [Digitaria exilis]|uniref:MADS-box domain-containing protein n=1 Tax=Digitaria exilis TaxID=1010633 RepID=A0A835EKP1_9POAL|nr:hypothetical protein HU200_035984 [Digitaria exilis]